MHWKIRINQRVNRVFKLARVLYMARIRLTAKPAEPILAPGFSKTLMAAGILK
jgi:hypothetical protein